MVAIRPECYVLKDSKSPLRDGEWSSNAADQAQVHL